MSLNSYLAQRCADGILVEPVSVDSSLSDGELRTVIIAGRREATDLALEAAKNHFGLHPERTRVLVLVDSE